MKTLNDVINEAVVKQHMPNGVGGKNRIAELEKQIEYYQEKINNIQYEITALKNNVTYKIEKEDLPCSYKDVIISADKSTLNNDNVYGKVNLDETLEYIQELIDFLQDKKPGIVYEIYIKTSSNSRHIICSTAKEDNRIDVDLYYYNENSRIIYARPEVLIIDNKIKKYFSRNEYTESVEKLAELIIKNLK